MYAYIDTIIPTFNTIIVFTVGIKLHIIVTVFYHRFLSYMYLYFIVFCVFCVVWDIMLAIL